jgi:hypothetical protein
MRKQKRSAAKRDYDAIRNAMGPAFHQSFGRLVIAVYGSELEQLRKENNELKEDIALLLDACDVHDARCSTKGCNARAFVGDGDGPIKLINCKDMDICTFPGECGRWVCDRCAVACHRGDWFCPEHADDCDAKK